VGLSFWVSANAAQGPPSTPPRAQSGVTFRSGTRLIVETVTVKDKSGKPIEGLTAKDFTLTEDGEPQTISFVEFQRVDGTPGPAQAAAPAPAPVASNVPAIAIPQISSSPPG